MDLRDIKEFFRDTFKYFLVVIIVLLTVIYVVSLQQVIGPSMNPNYYEGDVLILNKIKYRILKPSRFEVVAIENKGEKYFIKRVIGLPGETIEYKNNKLYINGELVEEKFKKEGTTEDFKIEDIGYSVIPEGKYFVVGDNRINSLDSRSMDVGLIDAEDFIGKVSIRIWPFRK